MCGITGAIWTDPAASLGPETLARMTEVLAHRGPDDAGAYTNDLQLHSARGLVPGVALGHRRLSIIDLAGGHQPLTNEDESIWVVFNGEIYNHRELRHRLEGSGHQFRSRSDTEVLVHLYEDEGLDFVSHLNGMFALALWDKPRRRLVIARDRLGKKPLYYRAEAKRLLFASELKSLLEVPGVERQIDPRALDEYLALQYVPHPRTIFRGIHKLPPATLGVFHDGQFTTHRYWNPDFNREVPRPLEDYVDEVRELLTSAVRLRLESDVPLGAFLSGGVDSSLVVGLMQRLSGERVKTFSIGFPVPQYDETAHARRVAERLGTEHHEFRVEPQAVDVLEQLVWHYDEPFADSSSVPTWYVAKLTRQHVTVALTGDGGDELFAGYDRYRAVQWGARLDRWAGWSKRLLASQRLAKWGAARPSRSFLRRLARFGEALPLSPQRRYYEWVALFREAERANLYSDAFLAELPNHDPFEFLDAAFGRASQRDAVTAASLVDLVTYLPCDLLTKVDIASMAHGLECRAPLLDYRLVELAAAMPVAYKLRGGHGKRILARAFPELLPREVTQRPKMGFGVPLAQWFRGSLGVRAREVLLDAVSSSRGYFRSGAVEQLIDEHQRGTHDHAHRLWGLLVLELWHRTWLDSHPRRVVASQAAR